ncbi:MAG: ABC transporter permease, partial [Defluviitaleaceae bacterium]|nr:ABC transporter permease [Defluviitaleaceae bacterium]
RVQGRALAGVGSAHGFGSFLNVKGSVKMKGYKKYYLTKLGWYAITFVIALMLNFFLPRLMPGDPIAAMVAGAVGGGAADASAIQLMEQEFIERFGLDQPMPVQFAMYVQNLLRGDLGTSFTQHPRQVSDILRESIVWTLALQIPAIIVGWILGNTLGAISAYIRRGFDKAVMPTFMFISSIPAFGMAIVMLWIFAITLGVAPVGGGFAFDMTPALSWEFFMSLLRHYQLPFWTVVLITIGGQAIGMRSMSIYELNADYVKYSRFLGIKDHKIVGYVFRNAMLPQITGLCFALGGMIAGNIVAETIFSYPGIGTTLLTAIRSQDFPLISASTLLITIMILFANLAVEIIYGLVDPRIKASQQDTA